MSTQDATPAFDPVRYKATTREQWQRAAEAWDRWTPTLQSWLGPATEQMLDLARVGPGDRVLDVAAGAGEPSMTAAKRVGPTGSVLATDISPDILAYARRAAAARGLTNLETRVMDGEHLDGAGRRVRRGALAGGPDLLSRSAARPRRNAAGLGAGRPDRGDRLLDGRAAIGSSRSRSASSAGGPSCRRRRRASPARSASAGPAC